MTIASLDREFGIILKVELLTLKLSMVATSADF